MGVEGLEVGETCLGSVGEQVEILRRHQEASHNEGKGEMYSCSQEKLVVSESDKARTSTAQSSLKVAEQICPKSCLGFQILWRDAQYTEIGLYFDWEF